MDFKRKKQTGIVTLLIFLEITTHGIFCTLSILFLLTKYLITQLHGITGDIYVLLKFVKYAH